LVNVFTRHTTAVLKINESEDWLWKDLQIWSDKVVPIEDRYHHNDLPNRDPKTMCASKEECLNWHSHIRSMLLGVSSEIIPVTAGVMMLGVRQRILLLELDHARPRTIIFSFMWDAT
jgi:secondary thiamine-phosphate synthase enzyme